MSRAAPPLLLLASAALVTCAPSVRTPSVDGIVKARACPTKSECPAKEECGTGDECPAVGGAASHLGFVVDDDYVLTYYVDGDGNDGNTAVDINNVWFRVTVPAKGAVFKAKGVSRVPDTGLALLKVLGKMKPVYVFAEQRVETERTVHAFTEIKGGHLPLVRGVVAEMDDQIDAAVVHIVHNALVDKAGYGSPLFNNCGEVVGVVVPAPSDKVLAGQSAVSTVPAGWLEHALTSDDQEENQQGGAGTDTPRRARRVSVGTDAIGPGGQARSFLLVSGLGHGRGGGCDRPLLQSREREEWRRLGAGRQRDDAVESGGGGSVASRRNGRRGEVSSEKSRNGSRRGKIRKRGGEAAPCDAVDEPRRRAVVAGERETSRPHCVSGLFDLPDGARE